MLDAHYGVACELAERAQTLHNTPLGQKLLLMARTLDMISVRR